MNEYIKFVHRLLHVYIMVNSYKNYSIYWSVPIKGHRKRVCIFIDSRLNNLSMNDSCLNNATKKLNSYISWVFIASTLISSVLNTTHCY